MKYLPLRPHRLHCGTCNDTYDLPADGTIKVYHEVGIRSRRPFIPVELPVFLLRPLQYNCPLDGFELVLFSLGNGTKAQGKSYPLCPFCYNHPPFEGLKRMGCNACLHPTCEHGLVRNSVCPCQADTSLGAPCGGTMVLDVTSRPNWKMDCNKCNVIVTFHNDIHAVKPSKVPWWFSSNLPSHVC
jgi:DNA topoisomerase III